MSKPSIQNITTTQTFQNWFDKTNEMVDLMRDNVVTAAPTGNSTTGNATLVGDFTATNLVITNAISIDDIGSRTPGTAVGFNGPIEVTPTTSQIAATFTYGAQGARTRYTDGTTAWDIGFDNTTTDNFIVNYGVGGQLSLSPLGILTVPSIITTADVVIGSDLTVPGTLTANTIVATTVSGALSGTFVGDVTGDIYHPAGGKVFENGGPAANIPATFIGNVNGTVSSLTNHTTNSLSEGTNNLYFTTARARASVSNGTGVSYATGVFSIGQSVGTADNVQFANISADDITCDSVTASGTIDADKFTGDGSELTGIVQLVKAHVTFQPNTGQILAVGGGLTVQKNSTGYWTIFIPENIAGGRPTVSTGYSILVGGVSDKVNSLGQVVNATNTIRDYNAYVQAQTKTYFDIRATRSTNSYTHFGGNDNNSGSIFGITTVDPATPITIAVLY